MRSLRRICAEAAAEAGVIEAEGRRDGVEVEPALGAVFGRRVERPAHQRVVVRCALRDLAQVAGQVEEPGADVRVAALEGPAERRVVRGGGKQAVADSGGDGVEV